jgi:hypothetical protein
MISRLIRLLVVTAVAFTGCSLPVAEVTLQARHLPHPNPTSYEFDASVREIKAAIAKTFEHAAWRKELAEKNRGVVWKLGGDERSERLMTQILQNPEPWLYWKGDADELTNHVLTRPGNEDDAYIYNGNACFESQVYFKDGQPTTYDANFHIHITPVSKQRTRVEVFTYDAQVGTGIDERPFSPHGPVLISVRVKPTTVEEYRILLRIGNALGAKGMPELVTPNPDSPVTEMTLPRD